MCYCHHKLCNLPGLGIRSTWNSLCISPTICVTFTNSRTVHYCYTRGSTASKQTKNLFSNPTYADNTFLEISIPPFTCKFHLPKLPYWFVNYAICRYDVFDSVLINMHYHIWKLHVAPSFGVPTELFLISYL